ncbi:unnamed protein product [Parascedosporium putredinis]|uniref:S-formylglutathione hydrolase n=1 Tax=Parascedosporium putredinis TaxID=1442378 RepID=A0A9P1HA11_9PEZI|nr:unnamed protein product [Parascedosporium putredinis]CAI8000777.1 unnamed protein product [Parascedosporium putredinis]
MAFETKATITTFGAGPCPRLARYLPRGLNLPGEDDSWDFGSAAGFYVDAKQEPWTKGYNMESYVVKELQDLVFSEFKQLDRSRVSITGHSMGGHGALTLYLKNPGMFKSAFTGYLGEDREEWKKHDATELVKGWKGPLNCLIDVGTGDNFYKQNQLLPENFEQVVKDTGIQGLETRYQEGYDHSYFYLDLW